MNREAIASELLVLAKSLVGADAKEAFLDLKVVELNNEIVKHLGAMRIGRSATFDGVKYEYSYDVDLNGVAAKLFENIWVDVLVTRGRSGVSCVLTIRTKTKAYGNVNGGMALGSGFISPEGKWKISMSR